MTEPTSSVSGTAPESATRGIDARGPRFGAALTAVLLAVVLVLQGTSPGRNVAALVVLAVIVAGFALGAFGGVQRTWQAAVFRTLVAPRLAPPTEREDPRPPTFAQLVGFVITGVGLVLGLPGVPYAVLVAAGLAFVAAFLNAVFAFCLGCEIYTAAVRVRGARA